MAPQQVKHRIIIGLHSPTGVPFYVLNLKETLEVWADEKYESHPLLGNH